jgi:hypothetical protein
MEVLRLSPTADVDASMLVAERNDIQIMAGILNDDHDASPSLTTAVRAAGAAGEAGKPLSNGSIHGKRKHIIINGLGSDDGTIRTASNGRNRATWSRGGFVSRASG